MTAPSATILAITVCGVGAVLSLAAARNKTAAGWVAFAAMTAAAALALYAAVRVLGAGPDPAETFLALPRWGSALRIHVDGLSALFLGLVAAIAVPASMYSIGYMPHYREYGVTVYYPALLLFVAGMYGIVTTTDMMLIFFGFWQLMTLPSFALIRYEWRRPENVRAANRYLLMMEIACLMIMGGAWLLAGRAGATAAGEGLARFDFDMLAAGLPVMLRSAGAVTTVAFALLLVGFGVKAGMWPFGQMWLPDAHPAAPSPVSALLSGVMIKTGVYGLLRTFIWLVPAGALPDYPAIGWGAVIATLGTITLFVGTMQALRQDQAKRLLAFSSIGQIGYMLLALGAAVALTGRAAATPGVAVLAAIGLYGALFHAVNHATFKSLLFLNAGSILHATGAQDLNRLGGLMRFMPVTAVTALVASASIAGVPLFNGFASKWTISVVSILGGRHAGYLAVYGVAAVLTSVITLALYLKFFGMAFLSRTSATVREQAGQRRLEVGTVMQIPQTVLAVACLAVGLAPGAAYQLFHRVIAASHQGLAAVMTVPAPEAQGGAAVVFAPLTVAGGQAILAPLVVAAVLGVLLLVAHGISRLGAAQRRPATAWLCGYAREADAHRYAARGLYGEVTRQFRWLGGVPRDGRQKMRAG
jgi:formate hydrogenlyase subunit 3/multisubunit Na+/H+ antiporter MnhD subunit